MSVALATRGYICPKNGGSGGGLETCGKGPTIVKVKDFKPEIRASKKRENGNGCG